MPAMQPVDFSLLADAIRQVEEVKGRPWGRHGELGPYQYTREAWEEDMGDLPFALAAGETASRAAALLRLKRLARMFTERRESVTVYKLAMAWNAGFNTAMLSSFASKEVRDYAVRVENLYIGR